MDIKVIPKLNLPQNVVWAQASKKKSINLNRFLKPVFLTLLVLGVASVISIGIYKMVSVENTIVVMEKVVEKPAEEVPGIGAGLPEDELVGWKNYQSPDPLNLSFAYPENWHILINTNNTNTVSAYSKATIVLSDRPIVLANKIQDYPIIIEISNQTLTFKERFWDSRSTKKRTIEIGDIVATEFIGFNPETELEEKAVVFYKDKKVYVIVGSLELHGNDYAEVFNELVDSLEFVS